MIKKIVILTILVFFISVTSFKLVYSQKQAEMAEAKAEAIHKHASSDVLYVDEELKALYYQNIQIIQVLKEIRDLLSENLQKLQEKEG